MKTCFALACLFLFTSICGSAAKPPNIVYFLMDDAGYDENTVLAKDETFFLRSTANLSTGGTAIDLTDVVHPDNREMAVRAIRAIGLDIGGVDFIDRKSVV